MNYSENENEYGKTGMDRSAAESGPGYMEMDLIYDALPPEEKYSRGSEKFYTPEAVSPAEKPGSMEQPGTSSGYYSYTGRSLPSSGFYTKSREPASPGVKEYSGAQPGSGGQEQAQAARPPVYTHQHIQSRVRVKKKRPWLAPVSLLVVCLLVVGGMMAAFVTHFDFGISQENGSVDFSIRPKDTAPSAPADEAPLFPSESGVAPQQIPESGASGESVLPVVSDSRAKALSIPEIAVKCMPSVVGIESTIGRNGNQGTSGGTGIIMSKDGYIVTNNHVIENASKITVVFQSGEKYDAKVIGSDGKSDLAVLKIEAENLNPAEFGNSDTLVVGETVVAIGNPLGVELQGTVTDGIVSAINRNVEVEGRTMTLIQTNAAINPGNSGGPLINAYGQVIGINTLKMSDYYQNIEGLGFAIPSSAAVSITGELIEKGYISGRPSIGISCREITERAANFYSIPQGVQVLSVDEISDAYIKGLAAGDIITKFNGKDVKTLAELNAMKEQYKAGDSVRLTVFRNGKTLDIEFKLMDEAVLSNSSIGEDGSQAIPGDPFGGMWP